MRTTSLFAARSMSIELMPRSSAFFQLLAKLHVFVKKVGVFLSAYHRDLNGLL